LCLALATRTAALQAHHARTGRALKLAQPLLPATRECRYCRHAPVLQCLAQAALQRLMAAEPQRLMAAEPQRLMAAEPQRLMAAALQRLRPSQFRWNSLPAASHASLLSGALHASTRRWQSRRSNDRAGMMKNGKGVFCCSFPVFCFFSA
jgi:hypothetical protein